MTNHRSLYTDFVIERYWGHLMGQFQVQWSTALSISSSFFKEKIARKDFSLIYKRKKEQKEKTPFPQVYTGTSQKTKLERENLSGPELTVPQIQSQPSFPALTPEFSLI